MDQIQSWKKIIKEKILSLADEYSELPDEIHDDDLILELGILDSAGIMGFIIWYEGEFSIDLTDDEINVDNLGTVAKMADFVLKKREAKSD